MNRPLQRHPDKESELIRRHRRTTRAIRNASRRAWNATTGNVTQPLDDERNHQGEHLTGGDLVEFARGQARVEAASSERLLCDSMWYPGGVRLLDLCCGAGGASVGYFTGFPDCEVSGVDLVFQPRFPFQFRQEDALETDLSGFDFVHCSPPCQGYTVLNNRHFGKGGPADFHPKLIDDFRQKLIEWGGPYVIENVSGASRFMRYPIALSGGMFGLGVDRVRLFEANFPIREPKYVQVKGCIGVYGSKPDGSNISPKQRVANSLQEGSEAMGIHWMNWDELTEAIPPKYTEHIAQCFLNASTGTISCKWCGDRFTPKSKTGRPQIYCSPAHKERAFRHRGTKP